MIRIILILVFLSFISCKKDEPSNIPTYISIENIVLNEYTTSSITDAWVYIDDNLQGVYELPANFPVLSLGTHKLRVKAGIKDNGIAGTRIPYPFYSSFIIIDQEFNPNEIFSVAPSVNYLDSINFFIEDFEGIGIDLVTSTESDTSIIEFDNEDNKFGGGILVDSLINFLITTDELIDLPQEGAPVYLELDYKCNTQFLVGVYVNFPQSLVLQKELLWITPQEDWNKIYVNLTQTISEAVGASSFKVFISMKRDFDYDTNTIYFDNLKIVY